MNPNEQQLDGSVELEAIVQNGIQSNESLDNIEAASSASAVKLGEISQNTEAQIIQLQKTTSELAEPLNLIAENTKSVGETMKENSEPISKMAAFLSEMKGEKGDKGETGEQGKSIKGEKGDTGEQGEDSIVPGPQGEDGLEGPAGETGQDGCDGKDGQDGKDGRDGKDGKDGRDADELSITSRVTETTSRKVDEEIEKVQNMVARQGSRTYAMSELSDTQSATIGQTMVKQADGSWSPATAGGGSKHTIQDEGVSLTQRTKLNFVGAGVTVTDGGAGPDSTIVNIAGVATTLADAELDSVGAAGSVAQKLYAVDSLQKRTLSQLKAFKTWAGNTQIFMGEFGTPKADASYSENERLFMEALNALSIPATYWAAGEFWGSYNLNAYEWSGTALTLNPFTKYLENNESNLRGVNIAGAEFGISPGVNGYHNTNLGVKNSNYFWPSTNYLGKIIDRGHKIIRLPFTWERLQPTLGGAFAATYLADLKTTVDFLRGRNVTVLLDVHNYGAYRTSAGIFKIGTATVTQAHFNDLWTRINTEFSTYENVWYGLMNEPANLTFAEWETVSQSTVTALRAAGATQKIVVALGNYSGIAQVSSHTTGPWITGGGDIMYEGHSYHDSDYSGDYAETYAASNSTASGQGHTAGFIDVGLDAVRADTIIGNSVKFINEAGTQLADLEADGDLNILGGYYINGAKITDASSPMYANSALTFGGTVRIDTGYVDSTTQAITVAVGDVVVCAIAGRKLVNLTSVTANGVAMTAPVAHQSSLNVTGAVTYYWVANVAGSINVVVASAGNFDQKTILVTTIAGLNSTGLIVDSYGVMNYFTSNSRTFTTNNGDVLIEIASSQGGGVFTAPSGATVLTNADHSDANMGATAVTYKVATGVTTTSIITPATTDNVARVSLVLRRNTILNYLPKDNTVVYTPTADYHPATKKYVLDNASGGMVQQTPTGTVNGTNVTFTVTVAPKFIVTDTGFYIAGFGYTLATLTVTMDLAPNSFIRSYS